MQALLDTIQAALQAKSRAFREEHTTRVETYDEFKAAMDGRPGFVVAPWAHDAALEAQVKTETQATLRNVPFSEAHARGQALHAQRQARRGLRLLRQSLLSRLATARPARGRRTTGAARGAARRASAA